MVLKKRQDLGSQVVALSTAYGNGMDLLRCGLHHINCISVVYGKSTFVIWIHDLLIKVKQVFN